MKDTIASLKKDLETKEIEIARLDRLLYNIKKYLWGENSYKHEYYQIKEELENRSFEISTDKIVSQEKIRLLTKENLRLWHLVRGKMGDKTLREEGLFKLNSYET